MALSPSFSTSPGETPRHYFRNICLQFKKTVLSSRDIVQLELEMQQFINASKNMDWHHQNSDIYRKDEGDKAAEKVWTEFKRYIEQLQDSPNEASPKDLIYALDEVERLIHSLKVT